MFQEWEKKNSQHIWRCNNREVVVTRFHTQGSEVIKNRTVGQKMGRCLTPANTGANSGICKSTRSRDSTARASLKSDEAAAVPALKSNRGGCASADSVITTRVICEKLEGVPAVGLNRLTTLMGGMCPAVCWSKHAVIAGVWSLTTGEGNVCNQLTFS